MPTLHNTLQAMQSSLLHRDNAAEVLIGDSSFEPAQRLQLYRNNLFIGLTDALAAVYPVVKRLVGEDFFKVTCHEFIPAFPPRQAALHEFGKAFPGFIRTFEPASSLPYLADVAELEWAWHEAYHAANADPLNVKLLQQVPQDQQARLRFTLHPAARLLKSEFPVHRVWQVNQEGYTGDETVNLDAGGAYILIARPQLEVLVQVIPEGEWEFLSLLGNGYSLDDALRAAIRIDSRFDLGVVLQSRVDDKTIVDTVLAE
jgi:hypothetical protein